MILGVAVWALEPTWIPVVGGKVDPNSEQEILTLKDRIRRVNDEVDLCRIALNKCRAEVNEGCREMKKNAFKHSSPLPLVH